MWQEPINTFSILYWFSTVIDLLVIYKKSPGDDTTWSLAILEQFNFWYYVCYIGDIRILDLLGMAQKILTSTDLDQHNITLEEITSSRNKSLIMAILIVVVLHLYVLLYLHFLISPFWFLQSCTVHITPWNLQQTRLIPQTHAQIH